MSRVAFSISMVMRTESPATFAGIRKSTIVPPLPGTPPVGELPPLAIVPPVAVPPVPGVAPPVGWLPPVVTGLVPPLSSVSPPPESPHAAATELAAMRAKSIAPRNDALGAFLDMPALVPRRGRRACEFNA